MKRHLMVVLALAFALVACGGDDSGSGSEGDVGDAGGGSGGNGLSAEDLGFDPDFGTDDLPSGFPSDLVPPSYSAGQFAELGGSKTVNFYSDLSFDDAVDYFNDRLGDGSVVGNDPGERLATWTQGSGWAVSVFEGDPLLIGFVELPG